MRAIPTIVLVVAMALSQVASAAGPKLGFILKDRSPFWAAVEKALHQDADKQGADIVVSAPMAIGAVGLQLKLFGVLLDQHCDVIVISPMSIEPFRAPIAAARAKGTKVVIFDAAFPAGEADASVGLDQDQISEIGAKLFVSLVHDGDEIAVLRSNGVEPLGARERKMRELLHASNPRSVVYSDVYIGVEQGDEEQQAIVLLAKHPDVKAVFTPYTAPSFGMMHALARQGLGGKVRQVGFGISLPEEVQTAIENDALQGWVIQQPRALAAKGLELAQALASGKTVPVVTKIPGIAVTKQNLREVAAEAVAAE
jgi:ABC-type sugar transport system substrate-binding protein